jgi:ATP-dependent Lon protease
MHGVRNTLDKAVYGHTRAKRQVERVIGQWVNGEPTGYCFGFEGPPGVGKTSLAKEGIANCLVDDTGETRPFAFVAIGGSSNGSTLEGHNYTYVGSTWGRMVDILIEKKCMNPIIFVDELDKVSRTEHGRELVGILTHLVDPAQNKCFQDKYFSGIDIDLSRVLFIFSYNDVDAIDRVLLDRIHRVKFTHLSIQEKLVVANTFLLPEIYSRMGLTGMLNVSDKAILGIISEYTSEPGVRKLKEILFEIVGEINLELMGPEPPGALPIKVTFESARDKYLKARKPLIHPQVHTVGEVGLMTGMWANAQGQGGILPIEATWRPSDAAYDLKLTGMQGDVMKESMAVARTVAWGLLTPAQSKAVEERAHTGVHVHVPEGATPKDGPSAGGAIALVLYSLFTDNPIRPGMAMTGEVCLQGKITAIGGLNLKIQGAQRAGVKRILYPKENQRDLDEFLEKKENTEAVAGLELHPIETIKEAISLCFPSSS